MDELLDLLDNIKKRKIDLLKIQLAIVQNPFSSDPNKLWNLLEEETNYEEQMNVDKLSFERLKQTIGKGSGIVIK